MPARAAAVDLARAADLHARAVVANGASQPERARRLLERGLRAVGMTVADADIRTADDEVAEWAVKIFITLGKAEAELHGLEAGLQVLERAAAMAEDRGDQVLSARVTIQRGLLYMRFGAFDLALANLAHDERTLQIVPPNVRCSLLLSRGIVRLNRLELAAARADFVLCARIAAAHELSVDQGMAEHNLGYVEFLAGDLVSALNAMNSAITVSADLPIGISALDRARVLMEAGLTREADLALAEAADVFARDRSAMDFAEVQLERARCALIAGEIASARRFAGTARDRYRRAGSPTWRRAAELVLIQADLAAGRPGLRLLEPALRLRDELGEAGLPQQQRVATLIAVEAALRAARVDQARDLLKLAAPSRRDSITTRLHQRFARAQLERADGRPSAARRTALAGLAELASHQARFGSIDLQTAAAVHGRRLGEVALSIALTEGRPEVVLDVAEQARAVSNRLVLVRPPADRDVAAMLAELRQVGEALHAAADRSELLRRRRELEREITARGWTLTGSGEMREIAGVEEIADRLSRDTSTLVSYVDVGGALHAVVLGAQCRLVSLGPSEAVVEQVRRLRADLDMLAQAHLPEAMRRAVTASARRSADALDVALVRPLALDATRLVIVSTGVLGQLPWAALASLRQVPVVVAPSATSWLAAASRRPTRRRGVFALAGPDVASGPSEVRGVAKAWPGAESRTGKAADRAALADALARGQIVHVAAHGMHQTENALFSSLRLADGMSFAHELDRTGRTADHVVLSACELGLATVRPGDEALGLTSVLLRLGTRSVVGGVARVGDESAAATMIDYHRRLAAGEDSASALAMAVAGVDDLAPFVNFGAAWSR